MYEMNIKIGDWLKDLQCGASDYGQVIQIEENACHIVYTVECYRPKDNWTYWGKIGYDKKKDKWKVANSTLFGGKVWSNGKSPTLISPVKKTVPEWDLFKDEEGDRE